MIKVYQKIIGEKGDCMRAVIASLFEQKLDDVPNFIEYDSEWFNSMWKFIAKFGYTFDGNLYNPNYTPNGGNILDEYSFKFLHKEEGVNGLFYASVFSPKFNPNGDDSGASHAVIVDKDLNVVFDPSTLYQNNIEYPRSKEIGYNGVKYVYLINPDKENKNKEYGII